jgi:hypothetical protein
LSRIPPRGRPGLSPSTGNVRVIDGGRVRRLEWENQDEYALLLGGWLSIHRHGKDNTWLISNGDLLGIDWVSVEN